jgi:hypothetical protein
MQVVVCWATRIHWYDQLVSESQLSAATKSDSPEWKRRRYRIKLASRTVLPSAHPDLSRAGSCETRRVLVYRISTFRRHQIRRQLSSESSLLCYGKSRITATTYNLFADKSTFEAKHRSYCTKVYSIQSQWILLMPNSPHDPLDLQSRCRAKVFVDLCHV